MPCRPAGPPAGAPAAGCKASRRRNPAWYGLAGDHGEEPGHGITYGAIVGAERLTKGQALDFFTYGKSWRFAHDCGDRKVVAS